MNAERIRAELRKWTDRTAGPALLILLCPSLAMIVWYTNVSLDGSVVALGRFFVHEGFYGAMGKIWRPLFFGTKEGWILVAIFAALELALMRVLPGKTVHGPVTPMGNVPSYKANGVPAYVLTLGLFVAGAYVGLYPASILYDHFGGILGALNVLSFLLCAVLYVKGFVAPSSSDHGSSGNPIFDYFWGTELYPRVFGWDVKMFTNCRFGMMAWPLLVMSFAAKQRELYGLHDSMIVAVALQLAKTSKFFTWETGYLRSLDIMHDRAGFYICWGTLVWVPAIYTASTLFLVNHPTTLGLPLSVLIGALGIASIGASYLADAERRRVRATGGACTVWGRPPRIIRARYATDDGEARENLLLASGFWGIARHFHYVPEILGAVFWTLPVGVNHALPWFYVTYLTLLLLHRADRDDKRCAQKYGVHWDVYRRLVPYRILPGLF